MSKAGSGRCHAALNWALLQSVWQRCSIRDDVGFVGAGGIGTELSHVISVYSDDRVGAVLILIVLTVTAIELLSERLRHSLIGKEALK